MSDPRDMEMGRFTLGWRDRASGLSPVADPEVLARAVRAHKVGDAFTQAALTFALMLAIGAVAFVLSAEHAAAAGLIVGSVMEHSAVLAAIAVAGGSLFLARAGLRRACAAARRR